MVDANIHLPRNVEAEAALIGAILIDNVVLDRCGELTPEHFFEPLHARLFERARDMIAAGQTASPVSLKPFFDADDTLKELGGAGYLVKLTADGSGLIAAGDFARQIRELALLREIIRTGAQMAQEAQDTREGIEPASVLERAQEALHAIQASDSAKKPRLVASAIKDALDNIELERQNEGLIVTKVKGLSAWNELLGGMRGGQLTILAGRPAMGKSLLAQRIATTCAMAGYAAEFISLEMSHDELAIRQLADLAYFDGERSPSHKNIATGNLTQAERSLIARACEIAADLPLRFDERGKLNIAQVPGIIRQAQRYWKAKGRELRLVVIDYLQLMNGITRGNANRTEEISSISRGLKQAATDLGVHIIALSQLSRALEARDDKRPLLSDLRESGSIEQDANNVVFAYREHYYLTQAEPRSKDKDDARWSEWRADCEAVKHQLDMICAKRRGGSTGTQRAYVNLEHQAIRDLDWHDREGML